MGDKLCKNCGSQIPNQHDSDTTNNTGHKQKSISPGDLSSKSADAGERKIFLWKSSDDDSSSDSVDSKRQRTYSIYPILPLKAMREVKKSAWDYDSDETLDSECEGQSVVHYLSVISRRRLQHKTNHPEDYRSSDDDSKYRSHSLKQSPGSKLTLTLEKNCDNDTKREENSSPVLFSD